MNLRVSEEVLAKRRKNWTPKKANVKGYLAKYAKTVQDASHGAIVG